MAALRLGAIVTTANPSYTSEELVMQFKGSDAKMVFTQPEQLSLMREVQSRVSSLKKIFLLNSNSQGNGTYEQLLQRGRNAHIAKLPRIEPRKDTALILYSSGTTGLPKGVLLTHYTLVANLCQTSTVGQPFGSRDKMLQLGEKDILHSCFPYFHIAGLFLSVLLPYIQGSKVLITPKFDLELFLKATARYKATILMFPPPVLILLSKYPGLKHYDLSSVRAMLCGAAAVPVEEAKVLLNRLDSRPLIIQGYGMTELSPMCHLMTLTQGSRTRMNSVGVLMPGTECKVVDTVTAECCKSGEKGELWIRGPQVMKGYLNNPSATRNTVMPDGFLRTGDIGYYDSDGYFYLVDRLKELIKVRGFQVAPAELEGLILTHPGVADVIVIGVPDAYSGELPRAYVIRKQGYFVTEDDIKSYIVGTFMAHAWLYIHGYNNGHVARYKQLAGGARFVSELPKTASGKPLRRVLLAEARKEMAKAKL